MDAGRDITIHDLKLLSIGFYIQSGIAAFYSVIMFGYMSILGMVLPAIGAAAEQKGQHPVPPFFVTFFTTLIMVMVAVSLTGTIWLLLTGYWLRRYRNRIFIFVVAGLSCLSVPYGTVLGIFTFMVLRRPVAEQLFAAVPPALPAV